MLSLPILFILIHFVISQSDLEYDLNKVEKFTCQNPLIDCSGYGTCSSQGDECICIDGYQTHFVNFSDYISNINVILFSINDLKLIKDTPSTRRKLINLEISELDNNYIIRD